MSKEDFTSGVSTVDQALRLAELGFYVFPLIPWGKTPSIDNFQERATRDPETIRSFWEYTDIHKVKRCHDNNVGIYGGRFGDDKALLILDVDNKKDKKNKKEKRGNESLQALCQECGELPHTLRSRTPSGGRHFYFTVDEAVRNRVEFQGSGLDIRSSGGYVVAPGGVSAQGHWFWETTDTIEVARAPEWLIQKAGIKIDPKERGQDIDPVFLDQQHAIDLAIEYLTKTAPLAVEGQGGDNTTYCVAASLKDMGVSEFTATELMWKHWNNRCDPPWDYEDIARKVGNAWRYGQNPVGSHTRCAQNLFPDVAVPPQARPVSTLQLENIEDVAESDLEPDRWIIGDILCRGYVTALVSAGGVGKTALEVALAGAVSSGKHDVIGTPVHEDGNVLILNNEDDNGILRKRWHALKRLHELKDGPGRVLIKGGARNPIRLARQGANGQIEATEEVRLLIEAIRAHDVAVMIVDPLVEFHSCDENNNVHMAAVAGVLRAIAIECNIAVLVVHHTRKHPQADSTGHRGSLDSARGGGSFGGTVRRAFTLSEMTKEEALQHCIREEDRIDYIVLDDAKANHIRRLAKGRWFRKESVRIATDEEVVALKPVTLKSRQSDLGSIIAPEITEITGGVGIIGSHDLLTRLVTQPMFADKARASGGPKTSFQEQVEAAFRSSVVCGRYRISLVEKEVKGTNARKWFEVTLNSNEGNIQ